MSTPAPGPGSAHLCLGILLAAGACPAQDWDAPHASASNGRAEQIRALPLAFLAYPPGAKSDPMTGLDPAAPFVPVPEPTTIFLFGSGLILAARLRRRRTSVT